MKPGRSPCRPDNAKTRAHTVRLAIPISRYFDKSPQKTLMPEMVLAPATSAGKHRLPSRCSTPTRHSESFPRFFLYQSLLHLMHHGSFQGYRSQVHQRGAVCSRSERQIPVGRADSDFLARTFAMCLSLG